MLSPPTWHRLAISKLDLLTAHMRCLRIIDQMCSCTFALLGMQTEAPTRSKRSDGTRNHIVSLAHPACFTVFWVRSC
jgi:hypothetical protein